MEKNLVDIATDDGNIRAAVGQDKGKWIAYASMDHGQAVTSEGMTRQAAVDELMKEIEDYGRQNESGTRAGGQRNVGVDTDGKAGRVVGVSGENQSRMGPGRRPGLQGKARRDAVQNLNKERSSPAGYGIIGGSRQKTAIFFRYGQSREVNELIDNDPELRAILDRAEARGEELTFFAGLVKIKQKNGKYLPVDGVQQGKRIFIQVDSDTHTASGLYDHEDTHMVIWENGGSEGELYSALAAELKEKLGEERYNEVFDGYAEAFGGLYDEKEIIEEMICDAAGRMNSFTDTAELSDAVRRAVDGNRKSGTREAETQTMYEGEETEPLKSFPGAKYSSRSLDEDELLGSRSRHDIFDVDSSELSDYDELRISAKDHAKLLSQALTWFSNRRNQMNRTTVGATNYVFWLDDDSEIHVVHAGPLKNIHEIEIKETYHGTDRYNETFDNAVERDWNRFGDNPNGMRGTIGRGTDSDGEIHPATLSGEGRGDRGRDTEGLRESDAEQTVNSSTRSTGLDSRTIPEGYKPPNTSSIGVDTDNPIYRSGIEEAETGDIDESVHVDRLPKAEAQTVAEEQNYPVLMREDGSMERAVPGWTWVRASDRGNYGYVSGAKNGMLEVTFINKANDISYTPRELFAPGQLTAVDAEYQGEQAPMGEAPPETDRYIPTEEEEAEFEAIMQEEEDRQSGKTTTAQQIVAGGELNENEEKKANMAKAPKILIYQGFSGVSSGMGEGVSGAGGGFRTLTMKTISGF